MVVQYKQDFLEDDSLVSGVLSLPQRGREGRQMCGGTLSKRKAADGVRLPAKHTCKPPHQTRAPPHFYIHTLLWLILSCFAIQSLKGASSPCFPPAQEERRFGTKFVFRQGLPMIPDDLRRVAASKASATIVISDSSRQEAAPKTGSMLTMGPNYILLQAVLQIDRFLLSSMQ